VGPCWMNWIILWGNSSVLLPNMRLKLTGAYRSRGSGVFAPWPARAFVHYSCADGRVARSLSVIR